MYFASTCCIIGNILSNKFFDKSNSMTLYQHIHHAILEHQELLTLPLATSNNDVYMAIRQVMRDNPDIFWFSHIWNYSEESRVLRLHYTIKKKDVKKLKDRLKM